MPTLIYLIGFMGSGKTTIGSILANVIGYDFVDVDEYFVQRIGMPIDAYFAEKGEAAFRRAESQIVLETTRMEKTVVSPGGGAFLVEANRSLMLQNGLTVYLRHSIPLLYDRLHNSRNRPLLFDNRGVTLKGEALRQRIRDLLEERRPAYEQAHLIIDVIPGTVGQTVDQIASEIHDFAKKLG